MTIYVSQNAFWGLLIGYRDRKGHDEMLIVEHALPFQSAALELQ